MKDAMICFRIGKRLRLALERISEEDRRSLSSTVEYILHDHLARRATESLGKERRGHARRTISEPALLRDAGGARLSGHGVRRLGRRDLRLGACGLSGRGRVRNMRCLRPSGYRVAPHREVRAQPHETASGPGAPWCVVHRRRKPCICDDPQMHDGLKRSEGSRPLSPSGRGGGREGAPAFFGINLSS